jgi:hypothetical protein
VRLGDEAAAFIPVEIATPAARGPATADERDHNERAAVAKDPRGVGRSSLSLGMVAAFALMAIFDAEALGRMIDVLDRRR